MIGIIDYDFLGGGVYPVLELMKIAEYHRKRGERVDLINNASKTAKYDKLYLWCNGARNDYPTLLLNNEKVIYNGYLFTGETYTPMDIRLERLRPYNELYFNEVNFRTSRRQLGVERGNDIIRGNWNRLTAGGEIIDPELQNFHRSRSRAILLTDDRYFFHYPQWAELLEEISGCDKKVFFVEHQHIPSVSRLEEIIVHSQKGRLFRPQTASRVRFYVSVPLDEVDEDLYRILSAMPNSAINIAYLPSTKLQDQRANQEYHCQQMIMYYSMWAEAKSLGYNIRLHVPPEIDIDLRGDANQFGEQVVRFVDYHKNSNVSLHEYMTARSTTLEHISLSLQTTLGSKARELINTPAKRFEYKTWKGRF